MLSFCMQRSTYVTLSTSERANSRHDASRRTHYRLERAPRDRILHVAPARIMFHCVRREQSKTIARESLMYER